MKSKNEESEISDIQKYINNSRYVESSKKIEEDQNFEKCKSSDKLVINQIKES